MALVRHVRSVLFRGQTADLVINSVKYAHFNILSSVSSRTQSDKRQFQDFRKPSCAEINTNTFSSVKHYRSAAGQFNPRKNPNDSKEQGDSQVPSYTNKFDPALVEQLLSSMDGDLPVNSMPDPFIKDYRRCFLCRQNVEIDHKNVRLLNQFVSPYTGRIYGRAITGLCIPMQKRVSQLILRARKSGFMPSRIKDPRYLQDPQPYDVMSKKLY
ncbi:hypothetical protein BsWGS_08826 [Bradybaena similaris]